MHKGGRAGPVDRSGALHGRVRRAEVDAMFFRTGEATLPRGFIFPGLPARDRSVPQREATGAPRRLPEDDHDAALDSANDVRLRSLMLFSIL